MGPDEPALSAEPLPHAPHGSVKYPGTAQEREHLVDAAVLPVPAPAYIQPCDRTSSDFSRAVQRAVVRSLSDQGPDPRPELEVLLVTEHQRLIRAIDNRDRKYGIMTDRIDSANYDAAAIAIRNAAVKWDVTDADRRMEILMKYYYKSVGDAMIMTMSDGFITVSMFRYWRSHLLPVLCGMFTVGLFNFIGLVITSWFVDSVIGVLMLSLGLVPVILTCLVALIFIGDTKIRPANPPA